MHFKTLAMDVVARTDRNVASINSLLSTHGHAAVNQRHSRAPLEVIGSLGKSLFGLARQRDLARMARVVNKLPLFSNTTADTVNHLSADFSAYMELANARFHSMRAHQEFLTGQIAGLASSFRNVTQYFEKILQFTALWQLTTTQYLQHLVLQERATSEFLQGVTQLIEGFLPPTLVTPADLNNALSNLATHLESKYPHHRIVHKSASYYYFPRNCHYMYNHRNIFIRVPVPLHT